jgi:putative oxidoreductase
MKALLVRGEKLYDLWCRVLGHAQSAFLLAIRLYWGWQFFGTGRGKFEHLDKVTEFFTSLGIPAPRLNVYLAATTELVGGLCLFLGLGGRIATIPLIFTMLVAYATDDREALLNIFSAPDKFVTRDPFLFLLAATIVLVFGPGKLSADHLIGMIWRKHMPSGGAAAKKAPDEKPAA